MERLTEQDNEGYAYIPYIPWQHVMHNNLDQLEIMALAKVIVKLCDYEDAEEQGKLFKFPVAMGDHFWITEFDNSNIREEWKVVGLEADSDGELYVDGWNDEYHTDIHVNVNRFGIDAFVEEKERHV